MHIASLLVLTFAVAVVAATKRAPQCEPRTTEVKLKIGGRDIAHKRDTLLTPLGCIWVLHGGKSDNFVDARTCNRCRTQGSQFSCAAPVLSKHPRCQMVRGPDCLPYRADKADIAKPCS